MPALQTVVYALNKSFARENVGETARQFAALQAEMNLDRVIDIVVGSDAAVAPHLKRYLGTVPPSIATALIAIIEQALRRPQSTAIVFSWQPAYDFELCVWEAPDTSSTRGGVQVTLKGRYPGDTHPLAGSSAS